jgi:hypothetical protein
MQHAKLKKKHIHTYEALCILTGLTPINIKIEEAFQFYHLTEGTTKEEALVDREMEV